MNASSMQGRAMRLIASLFESIGLSPFFYLFTSLGSRLLMPLVIKNQSGVNITV